MFSEHFAFQLPALANFVGGGGKTGLILKLAEEYSPATLVIYTTTTRIHPPRPARGLAIISCDDPTLLETLIERAGRQCSDHVRTLVVTNPTITDDLLKGVRPDFGRALDRSLFPVLLNEADGARSMSLKMPREGEPVLMEGAEYLVPVIGLDCINKPLGPDTLFRWEIAEARYSLESGRRLTPKLAASLLLHPEGVCKDWKRDMRIVPFINKVDSNEDDPLARELALALISNDRFPVERVVWGSLLNGRANSLEAKRA